MFNLQNIWILFNGFGNPNKMGTLEIALQTFKTHMNQTYVLPDSRVYLLIKIDNDLWEIWDGFRLSVSESVQVSKVGTMTPDRVEIRQTKRSNFHSIVLKASTVVSLLLFISD